jgi:hypothetical protein
LRARIFGDEPSRRKGDTMKSVCLRCNRPLEHHRRITAEIVASSQGATYEKPVNGFRAPLSPVTIGQWLYHEPMMSRKPPTWATPFGTSEVATVAESKAP